MGSGAGLGLTCINYPQHARMLPSLFVPTVVSRRQLNPGEVHSFKMAPHWAAPAAVDGKHAVSVADSSLMSLTLLANDLRLPASAQACDARADATTLCCC